jgi:hypothetical protein
MLREINPRSGLPLRLLAEHLRAETPAFESVLAPNVEVTPFVVLPLMAFICARHNLADLRIVPQLEHLVDPVVKWSAVASLASFRLFVRNPDSFIRMSESYDYQANVEHRLFPSFALVQSAFGLSHDKNRFLTYVATIFGLSQREPCDDEPTTIRNIEFAILHFVLCLLFDRVSITDDIVTARGMIVVTRLTHTPTLSLKDLGDIFSPPALRRQQFMTDLATYTTMVETRTQLLFRIREGVEWHPLLPFVRLPWILEAMTGFSAKNPDKLVPFPEFAEEPPHLELRSGLVTPFLFGFIYHLLSNFVHQPDSVSIESLNLVCNSLICIAKLFPNLSRPVSLTAPDIATIIEQMPPALDAVVSYRGREPASILNLLATCGTLGRVALDKLQVQCTPAPSVDQKAARRRAIELRRSVMDSFRTQQSAFLALSQEEEDHPDECVVCHLHRPHECFGFPIYAFGTLLPALVQAQFEHSPFVMHDQRYGFHVCEHLVHLSCFRSRVNGRCAIDRGRRNAILPKIEHDIPDAQEIEADARFMREVFNENTSTALRSLAGEVDLLEVRSRARLACLQKSTTATTLFYLFMSIRRFSRDRLHDLPIAPSESLLCVLLQCEDLPKTVAEFRELLQPWLTSEMTPINAFVFLRRAFIVEHFILRIGIDRFADWQECLSSAKLREHYALPPLDGRIELPLFRFANLPDRFIDFVLPPYGADLSLWSKTKEVGMCLLTGKITETDRRSRDELNDHINRELARTFMPWLVLTGPDASSVFIVTSHFRSSGLYDKPCRLKGFYVDSLGYEDVGLVRGQILRLSTENLDAVIETLLSGEWVDCEPV